MISVFFSKAARPAASNTVTVTIINFMRPSGDLDTTNISDVIVTEYARIRFRHAIFSWCGNLGNVRGMREGGGGEERVALAMTTYQQEEVDDWRARHWINQE